MDLTDGIRALGFVSAGIAIVAMTMLAFDRTNPACRAPWRQFACAAGLIMEISGAYARFDLWGTPLSYRDVVFLAVNALAITACIGWLVDSAKRYPPEAS